MNVLYPARGVVSLWIGNFESEAAFDECLDGPISKKLGLQIDLGRICEIWFEEDALPIQSLLQGFSGWESFIEKAVHAAELRHVSAANAALVCYYLKCENAPEKWGKMDFLGTFSGSDVSNR